MSVTLNAEEGEQEGVQAAQRNCSPGSIALQGVGESNLEARSGSREKASRSEDGAERVAEM